ncbi:hypothetical protein UFOVP777_7 [uncultured Caudovirales phage]|uniref:Bacteriocin n=1 Tax=uncultured Caudovirales phage TaxID=2100421 RepID=A0A6J5NXW5_9CAUD|nr:hypothetical protein UFOVP777_7 [uncultured Caudovirales phage]
MASLFDEALADAARRRMAEKQASTVQASTDPSMGDRAGSSVEGSISGAGTGASIGGTAAGPYGAVVGAILGAIAGGIGGAASAKKGDQSKLAPSATGMNTMGSIFSKLKENKTGTATSTGGTDIGNSGGM